jgi:hypothetical protein
MTHVRVNRNSCMVLMEKSERNGLVGRLRHRPEDNIKMDVKKTGCSVWTALIWLRPGTRGRLLQTL